MTDLKAQEKLTDGKGWKLIKDLVPSKKLKEKVIEKVKPSVFINLGDFAEGEMVSHWRWSRRRRPPLEYQLPLIDKEAD